MRAPQNRQRRGAIGEIVLNGLASFPFARVASSTAPIALLYHGVPATATDGEIDAPVFERHIRFLKSRYEIVDPAFEVSRKRFDKVRVVLTFDDGFQNNAEVAAPILRRYGVPAAFFVCTRFIEREKFLWHSYLDALKRFFRNPCFTFRGELFDMRPGVRSSSVERLRGLLRQEPPHPDAMYEIIQNELPAIQDFVPQEIFQAHYAGMTPEQVGEIAADPLFTIGSHTTDHPFLSDCAPTEMEKQIRENRQAIESITGKGCDVIAYPSGDYDSRVLGICERLGFKRGYAVRPVFGTNPRLEIPRIGIYEASEPVLAFKVQWGRYLRSAGVSIG